MHMALDLGISSPAGPVSIIVQHYLDPDFKLCRTSRHKFSLLLLMY